MSKRIMSLMLIGILLNMVFYTSTQANSFEKEAKYARKVKSEISKLGSGESSNIKIKLRDKSKLTGYISEIGENSFVIINKRTNKSTEVLYSQVKKASGNNYSTGQKILIGIGLVFAIGMIKGIALSDDY